MHITLEADYAVRIVYCLAKKNKRMDAKMISENTGVTLRFSLKILRKLVASGLIHSFKGTQGGYELAKNPDEITLREIIETVEGDLSISRCLSEDFTCTCKREGPCQFQPVYDDISRTIEQKLEEVTIGSVLKRDTAPECAVQQDS